MPIMPSMERSSVSKRRGDGARRRGNTQEHAASSQPGVPPAKTALLDEFRAHEEDCAARVLQHAARGFLGRLLVTKLLLQVYRRQYDPIEKKYFYLNTQTNEASWEKPKALELFLPSTKDVQAIKDAVLTPPDAAKRIQRVARVFLAFRSMKRMLRENYMKLFNDETKTYYYLNTRTGATADHPPPFLRQERDDLPVEMFYFRRAVCKLATRSNPYGSGVLGIFGSMLCMLSDGQTLLNEDSAIHAHAVCNYSLGCVSFSVILTPDRFFLRFEAVEHTFFTLCAVDRPHFESLAGENIVPLRFELNDRKLGCVDGSMKTQDPIEVVGHPYGKLQVVHQRVLAKMVPHSISPLRLVYDREMESGAVGSAIFTRGGRLLGLQSFTSLKEPPTEFVYIRPILQTAITLVTPPEPFLLATCVAPTEIHTYWQIPRWCKPIRGLELRYELEYCRHDAKQVLYHTQFACVYVGTRKSKQIGELQSDTMYSVRVRSAHAMAKSSWSAVLRLITHPTPSMAWRVLRYCTSIADATQRLRRHHEDAAVHLRCVQWLLRHVNAVLTASDDAACDAMEQELIKCETLEVLIDATGRFADDKASFLLTLELLRALTARRARTQQFLSTLPRLEWLMTLLREFSRAISSENSTAMELLLTTLALLGHLVDENASAKQLCEVVDAIPFILSVLTEVNGNTLHTHQVCVAECCFFLGRYTHNHSIRGKWIIVDSQGVRVFCGVLTRYETDATIVYWCLVTLGNVAYGVKEHSNTREQLEAETNAHHLIDIVCRVKMLYLVRLNELELEQIALEAERERLQANLMDETMRNDLDACELAILTVQRVINELKDHHVGQAADFALHYLLTDEQRRVQQASQWLMKKFLLRKLSMALATWQTFTIFERNCAIMRHFLTTVRHRQLSAAFRRWEGIVREWRKHKTLLQSIGAGLAIDLNKKKRERYRMLVLQK